MTLEQVAVATGLGRTTVSDILNRNVGDKYSRATREQVLKAVRHLGYTPSRAAQVMARGRSGLVGLLLTRDFSNPFWARVANHVEQELRARQFRMQLAITQGRPEDERQLVDQLYGDQIEGLIMGPVYETLDLEEHHNVLRGRLPVVLFGGICGNDFDNVALDHEAGKRIALEYLLARGHKRIGYLCAPPSRLRPDEPNVEYHDYQTFSKKWACYNRSGSSGSRTPDDSRIFYQAGL
ncbi:MAG: LacI family transcriptional regulator, partial [Phycisphaerales bacterium]|nr:LacI family transcriptional regulator [Phycisphaerales bacterium]